MRRVICAILTSWGLVASTPSLAALKSCEQIQAIDLAALGWENQAWMDLKPNDASKYQVRRKQAEVLKILEAVFINKIADMDESKIKALSDEALDEAGEGIFFAAYTDAERDKYDFAQIGFDRGNKWFGVFFKQGTSELATRFYINGGTCETLPASPYSPAA